MANFVLPYIHDKAPKPLRERDYCKKPVVKVKGLVPPPQINTMQREVYVPPLDSPIRKGALDFKKYPSRYGTQSTYHDRGHC